MNIYILDQDFNILDVFSTYESIVWETAWDKPGTFKAVFIYTNKLNKHLQLGNILYKPDEDEPAIISRKYIKLNKYGEKTITIQGYMAGRYTHQRIIWRKMILKGTPEQIMYQMVNEQIVAPEDEDRRMKNVILGECHDYDMAEVEKQISYANLQESLTEIAKEQKLGYRMRLDFSIKKLIFEVTKGKDRTLGTESPCIFSRTFHNVYTQEYQEDAANYYNTCLIGGPGEDTDRILEVAGGGSGVDRYEMFYNAAGFSTDNVTEERLRLQLVQRGTEKLAGFPVAKAFESKINKKKAMRFDLGDFVTCIDTEWGITENAQVKNIQKGYSKAEQSFVVTFGDEAPTLINLIKAKE
ncbi:MAG: siphovirus ReqiPepy6 Gp37-like family protein [Firmicutes bacterium]|nr:siphovirus ReqiPepy6 Gp37-like family protein [Bacillota bacterium]